MKHSHPHSATAPKHLPQARRHRRPKRRWPICEQTGKRRYHDWKDAKLALEAARYIRATAELNGLQSAWTVRRPYYCDHCDGAHLTARPAWTDLRAS
jgi:hypothetical protein